MTRLASNKGVPPCPQCGAGPPTVQCFWEGKQKIAVCTHCAIQAKIVTADTLIEDMSDRLATARTLFLSGEQTEARQMLQQVRITYLRHRESLADTPGLLALRQSIEASEGVMGA